MKEDQYSRVDYRQLIAWPKRIAREWPLIESLLAQAPVKRVLDLGAGTGEHARHIASHGFEVVGVDASETMIGKAREIPAGGVEFIFGDFRELEKTTSGTFGAAICLGNALPHLREDADIDAMARGLAARLAPGAPVLIQILNYERIFAANERSLPINVMADEMDAEGMREIVFLRLMKSQGEGRLLFFPTTLRLDPDAEEPVEVLSTHRVELRGWRRPELEAAFARHGFTKFEALGGYDRAAYDAGTSRDLLLVAWRG